MLSYILASIFTNLGKCFCHNIRLEKKQYTISCREFKACEANKNAAPAEAGENDHDAHPARLRTAREAACFPPSLCVSCGCARPSVWRMSSGSGRLHCPRACGILVPSPGIKPTSLALEGRFLTTEPPGKSFHSCILKYRVYIILS